MDQDRDWHWEAGFEGDRRIVVSRFGPFRRVFPRPKRFLKRFYHHVHELLIEDWSFPLEPLRLGPLCTIEANLSIRFQPTVKFAREHLECIADFGGHIRTHYRALLQDAAEQVLGSLEAGDWLDRGYAEVERRIENVVHELLAMRDIQSRSRCTIETAFVDAEDLEEHAATVDPRYRGIYNELLKRRRESLLQLERERCAREAYERQLKLQHEERMAELARKEAELLRLRQVQETEQIRAEMSVEEMRAREQYDSELRLREERILHESRLKQIELETELAERQRRAEAMNDVENHLRREIEFLALERQRLLLEEEIHDVKVAKAKGWIINAKRRFPLGESQDNLPPQDAEIAGGSGKE
jgi:hypothetical protein